jgi:hypothetical protein
MLECAVNPPSAKVIAAKYPTPSALVAACAESRKRTADEIDPIAELALPDGKRVGKDVASNLRIHFSD